MNDFLIRNFPKEIKDKLDAYQKLGKIKNQRDGVIQLCKIALDVIEIPVDSPELVQRIKDKWRLKQLDNLLTGISDDDKRIFQMWLQINSEDENTRRLLA